MSRHTDFTKSIDLAVGKKVEELRLSYGLSRKMLSDRIDVTHQQLQKYEKGTNRISIGRLVVIAKALEVPLSYFVDEEEVHLPDNHKRLTMEVSRSFMKIKNPVHQAGVHYLVKTLEDK